MQRQMKKPPQNVAFLVVTLPLLACAGFFPTWVDCLSVCSLALSWIPTPLAALQKIKNKKKIEGPSCQLCKDGKKSWHQLGTFGNMWRICLTAFEIPMWICMSEDFTSISMRIVSMCILEKTWYQCLNQGWKTHYSYSTRPMGFFFFLLG